MNHYPISYKTMKKRAQILKDDNVYRDIKSNEEYQNSLDKYSFWKI